MAKQTFTTGQVLTAAQMTSLQQTAMLGGSASAKTASYTLVAADAGTAITMNNAGATTITVNTGLFAAGDTVTILNIGAGTCTITAGTATVSKPASASLALVQNAGGVLYFTATGTAFFMPFDTGVSGTTSPKLTFADMSATFTTTSTTFVDLTGMSISITPSSATNKIWISCSFNAFYSSTNSPAARLVWGSTNLPLLINTTSGDRIFSFNGFVTNMPASATTIKVQVKSGGGVSQDFYGNSAGYVANIAALEIY